MPAVSASLLKEETVVTEKLDGGNCCLHDQEVYARTHSAPTTNDWFSRTKMRLSSFAWVQCLRPLKIFGENMEVCALHADLIVVVELAWVACSQCVDCFVGCYLGRLCTASRMAFQFLPSTCLAYMTLVMEAFGGMYHRVCQAEYAIYFTFAISSVREVKGRCIHFDDQMMKMRPSS